jgi:hypothetical protein
MDCLRSRCGVLFLATKPAPIKLHTTGGLPVLWDDPLTTEIIPLEPFLAEMGVIFA